MQENLISIGYFWTSIP